MPAEDGDTPTRTLAPAPPPPPPPAPKRKLIIRLGALLVSHSVLVSALCCTAGFVVLLLLPVLAKNTYISENALLPGSANPALSSQDVLQASRFVKDIIGRRKMEKEAGVGIETLIGQRMADIGAEVYYHQFQADKNQFNPLQFFSCNSNPAGMQSNSSTSAGVNSVGIIRAPRGDGKEAIVLVTPYNSENIELNEALSLGLGFSIFSHLGRVSWLAKDIIWLAADSRYGEYSAVSAWLKEYQNPTFLYSGNMVPNTSNDRSFLTEQENNMVDGRNPVVFRRAGTMAAALVFKVVESMKRDTRDSLAIYAEATNGQMPNLDLINVLHYLAVHRQGFRVDIGKLVSLVNSEWLNLIAQILQWISNVAESLNPKWKFSISSADYVESAATLASSMYYQALGVPTGSHGAFRDYQIDAISFVLSPTYMGNEKMQSAFLLRGGRLIEGVIRSVNNLLEKFHQSFFLYFLTSPNKFVSVGVYMIAFALLAVPLPIIAAALFSSQKLTVSAGTEATANAFQSWNWLHAAKVVLTVHLWAVIVSLLPYFISQNSHITSTESMLVWIAVSVASLLILHMILGSPYSLYSEGYEWQNLKAVMIAAVSIGLCLMSIINFATAQIGALFIVPMCLMVLPFKQQMQRGPIMRATLFVCNLVLGVIGFPPAVLLLLKGISEGFGQVDIGLVWELAEFLWSWNSATYLYLVLVHLPCWALCVCILLHP